MSASVSPANSPSFGMPKSDDQIIAAMHANARDNWPWQHLKESGAQTERQQQLLMALANSPGPLTQREMFKAAQAYGYPDMTNGSRISELLRAGAIRMTGRRKCNITGQCVFTYALTGVQPNKPKHTPVRDALVLYVAIREVDGQVTRVASHPIKLRNGEVLGFYTADRRRSTKHHDGTSRLPAQLNDFEFALVPSAPGSSGRPSRRMKPVDSQPELDLAGAGSDAGTPSA